MAKPYAKRLTLLKVLTLLQINVETAQTASSMLREAWHLEAATVNMRAPVKEFR